MPEQAQEGVVTNTGQPLVAIGLPTYETENAAAGVAPVVGNVTAEGIPAAE